MERKPTNISTTVPQIPRENPRVNGTGPAKLIRKDEQCKKHIRKDGRK